MCDFSNTAKKSRKANVGDQLRTTSFGGGSVGFGDTKDMETAVCLMPGTELAFKPEVVAGLSKIGGGQISAPQSIGTFRQINKHQPNTHHDVIEFPNAEKVYVSSLPMNLEATVLQLPVAPTTPAEADEQRRAEFVG